MVRFLLHVLGVDDLSGRWYGWWSGAGSDLSYFGVFWALVRRHNCHVPWCPRIGRHPLPEQGWLVCTRHHQGPKATRSAVAAASTPREN